MTHYELTWNPARGQLWETGQADLFSERLEPFSATWPTSGMTTRAKPKVMEFFAGIGLARMGLERAGFEVAWANDYERDKRDMYVGHFGETTGHTFALGDIAAVDASELPTDAALAWASSPCTDLSLAGGRAGLAGRESGVFWHFVKLLDALEENRPPVVVLENVTGLATSRGGDDLSAAITAFNELGYSVDVLALDARRFLPQSRPRMFVIGALNPPPDTVEPHSELRPDYLQWVFGDPNLRTHRAHLPDPPGLNIKGLSAVVEDVPTNDERWWDADRTAAFVESLSPTQRDRVNQLRRGKGIKHRTAYRRTRGGVAVWEVRPDDISGCLRTARGGSSKQAVVRLGNRRLQVRWMTPLEYARLMGAGEYNLNGSRNNQALFGFGDAVAVPVVKWLGVKYLLPLVNGSLHRKRGGDPMSDETTLCVCGHHADEHHPQWTAHLLGDGGPGDGDMAAGGVVSVERDCLDRQLSR